jgi:hypothetical protein
LTADRAETEETAAWATSRIAGGAMLRAILDWILLLFQLVFLIVILVTALGAEPSVEKYLVLGALAVGALLMIIVFWREAKQEK